MCRRRPERQRLIRRPRFAVGQGPPEYGRSCDYSEQVTIIAYCSLW